MASAPPPCGFNFFLFRFAARHTAWMRGTRNAAARPRWSLPLGEMLVQAGRADAVQVEEALTLQ